MESESRQLRVYTDGIFDVFHYGHARALKVARDLFPDTYLIVGVCGDEVTASHKGKTVLTHDERVESVKYCRWVDEVVENAPWEITEDFVKQHQIDYVVHGDDPGDRQYQPELFYKYPIEAGIFRTFPRQSATSTSELILRILRNYNAYVMRELHRGYSRQDINISLFKEKQIQLEEELHSLASSVSKAPGVAQIVGFLRSMGHNLETISESLLGFPKGDTVDQAS
eukprot:TRINITY_DN16677_c0_g1_i1.p1 TRINITY_DN16677_c0_g1~~TRINITY_DN16677_c0_g1_i1.p1  ORF type:complete len:226 (-),score=42.89 TRINITY_DN16677_c0_g1_i1:222-899(-)